MHIVVKKTSGKSTSSMMNGTYGNRLYFGAVLVLLGFGNTDQGPFPSLCIHRCKLQKIPEAGATSQVHDPTCDIGVCLFCPLGGR